VRGKALTNALLLVSSRAVFIIFAVFGTAIRVLIVLVKTRNATPLDVVTLQPSTATWELVWVEGEVGVELIAEVITSANLTLHLDKSRGGNASEGTDTETLVLLNERVDVEQLEVVCNTGELVDDARGANLERVQA
jgi:hypothetical protein